MQLPTALALFCEDIRAEKAGIDSLVGILPDNIAVAQLPGLMPKLAVYLRTNLDPNQESVPISYRLVLPGGQAPVSVEIEKATIEKAKTEARRDGNPIASMISKVMMSPFPIEQQGRMSLIVQFGDKEFLAGSLNIKVETTASSGSSPPSAQSPDASQPKAT